MASSSAIGPQPPQHQVFICFRGVDVRYGFQSFLRAALKRGRIKVAADVDAVRGQPIYENLLKMIKGSRIAVVIFSENFSDSEWCLGELVEIKKRMDLGKMKTLPIFFRVKPDDVQNATGRFGDILLRLENDKRREAKGNAEASQLTSAKIDQWRDALESVSDIMGLTCAKDRYQAPFVDEVVERVKEMLANIPSEHQVYINFRGGDVRKSFLSCLVDALRRNGIGVFIDVEMLIKGEDPRDTFNRSIREARVALVIFSTKYAQSRLSLDELVEIKNLMATKKLQVIPIFYNVKSSDVRRRMRELSDKLRYRTSRNEDRIMSWREALECVMTTTGFTYGAYGSKEADLVDIIVEKVKKVLARIPPRETENPPACDDSPNGGSTMGEQT